MVEWLAERVPGAKENGGGVALAVSDLTKLRADRKKAFPTFMESDDRIAARFCVLKRLNIWVRDKMLPQVDIATIRETAHGRCLSDVRELLFRQWKMERFNAIVEETFTNEEGDITLNRQLAIDCAAANECDMDGSRMLFAQAATRGEELGVGVFRSRGPNYNRPLCIRYLNEEGIDQGGLYRDFFAAASSELMSRQLPLLIPTPNSQNNAGECREAWTLAPRPVTGDTRRMLRFLGKVMGICVRRGDVLPLALSRITWKLLVGDRPKIADLALSDVAAAESVRQLSNLEALGVGASDFEFCFGDLRFVYHNSMGEEVPLTEGGAQKRATFENAREFAQLVLEMRTQEASEQAACILEGLAMVIPVGCLSLWSWRDLEHRVCGDPRVDVQLMRRKVQYESTSEDEPRVRYLWAALESYSQQDLQLFLRFCWGRSRLPPESSPLWGNGFIIAGVSDLPEDALPRAHTCFFQIDVPNYTSEQICTERVRYAIQNCVSMLNS